MTTKATTTRDALPSTFESFFFEEGKSLPISVPDYQRAFSWKDEQVDLFIDDMATYSGDYSRYYFGHFIIESHEENSEAAVRETAVREVVDGQQRLTTFVLFLMVCQALDPGEPHTGAYSLIEAFSTVSYDMDAMRSIGKKLAECLKSGSGEKPTHKDLKDGLAQVKTRSQQRMVEALIRIYRAFHDPEYWKHHKKLDQTHIEAYIKTIMKADCSYHLTYDKSVAVRIFEMHNTRGMPLTTLEVVKALLMQFVYDNSVADKKANVEKIQEAFGQIYALEEQMETSSFRGKMTMEQLLRLHLRVVADGTKSDSVSFNAPSANASADKIIDYVRASLRSAENGVAYALNLAKEFQVSVGIVSQDLPAWDEQDGLVGDVMILERALSCQFFLLICRRLESVPGKVDGRVGSDTLVLWERLLFTRDFHWEYSGVPYAKRDNFPKLFAECIEDEATVAGKIQGYVDSGFRSDRVGDDLKATVANFLESNKMRILTNAYSWYKGKMIYAIYKYEVQQWAKLREVMHRGVSVEHIVSQEWKLEWFSDHNTLSESAVAKRREVINGCVHGLGNLLLLTQSENSSASNEHPTGKMQKYSHYKDLGEWDKPEEWPRLIKTRGERIYDFMLKNLVGMPGEAADATSDSVGD